MSRHRRRASATTLPASPIKPISRGDFNSGALWKKDLNMRNQPGKSVLSVQCSYDGRVNLFDIALTRYLADEAARPIVPHQLDLVAMIDAQPLLDGFLLVVVALHQGRTTKVARAGDLGWIVDDVVRCLAS